MVSQTSKTVRRGILTGGVLLLLFLAGCNYNSSSEENQFINKMSDEFETSEWVCIATRCSDWVEGDEWVASFCRPANNTLMCDVELDGQTFKTPYDNVNLNAVRSCKQYECVTEILARTPKETKNGSQ